MFPLQNQEPVIAYPCTHLGCPKKWFWRTPGGPDNGVEIFGGILKHWNYEHIHVPQFSPTTDSLAFPALDLQAFPRQKALCPSDVSLQTDV